MKAYIEMRDHLRRFVDIYLYDERLDGFDTYYALRPGVDGASFERVEVAESQAPPVSVALRFPVGAVEAIIDAAAEAKLGAGRLDTLFLETLTVERARVEKMLDHLLGGAS